MMGRPTVRVIEALNVPSLSIVGKVHGGSNPRAATLDGLVKAFNARQTGHSEKTLRQYAARIGNTGVAKRLGFIMEALGLGDVEALRSEVLIAPGFSSLDLTMPKKGKYNRRWGLLVNAEVNK